MAAISHTATLFNFSGRYFKIVTMNVHKDTELLDYEEAEKLVEKERPKLIMAKHLQLFQDLGLAATKKDG